MKPQPFLAALLAMSLAGPVSVLAGEPDADASHPGQYAKDSAISAAVKTKLAASYAASRTQLSVETDSDGVVWLSGTAQTQEAADRAVEAARNADGVMEVKSTIVVSRTK